MGRQIPSHPPYSSDLAPCEFRSLNGALRGKKFSDNEEIKVMGKWLKQQGKDFFAPSKKKLVQRWEKCINIDGDYVVK